MTTLLLKGAGPHVYQVMPSAVTYDCKAMAIGARSQSARTYLEKQLDSITSSAGEQNVSDNVKCAHPEQI